MSTDAMESPFPNFVDNGREVVITDNTLLEPILTADFFEHRAIVQLPSGLPGSLSLVAWQRGGGVDRKINVVLPDTKDLPLYAVCAGTGTGYSFNAFREFPNEMHPFSISFRLLPTPDENEAYMDNGDDEPTTIYSQSHRKLKDLVHDLVFKGGLNAFADVDYTVQQDGFLAINPIFTISLLTPPEHFPLPEPQSQDSP